MGERVIYFYADDGKILGEDKGWLYRSFGTLLDMFKKTGIQNNENKYMVCDP